MFQYAAARALAERRATSVVVDLSAYRHPRKWEFFQLWRFERVHLRQLPLQFFFSLSKNCLSPNSVINKHIMHGLGFDEEVTRLSDGTKLVGYFTSEIYFKDYEKLVRYLFNIDDFLNKNDINDILKQLMGRTPVSLHVRRGDYVNNNLFDIGNLDNYYRKCMNEIISEVKDPLFVIFSDDPKWLLRWDVLKDFEHHIISGVHRCPLQDMALIAWCQHHIISNSTFSWWAAWLNASQEKRVFMPSRWLNKWTSSECGLSVVGWTEIDP